MNFDNFSSFPHDQEAGFAVYEQRMTLAQKSSFTAALVAAIAVLVLALGIYAGVAPDDTDVTKDMNMSNLTSAPGATNATSDTPAATGSGSAAAPAAAPAGSGSASGSASGSN